MKVLVTGAFGNVGCSTLDALLEEGHQVRCFDVPTPANVRAARKLRSRVEVVWGDLRRPEDLDAAVRGQDVVIHLAFIIPKLSATGFESEDHPEWAKEVNVGGTRNQLEAMRRQPVPPRLVFASSYHIYGRTQHLPPPRTVSDPPQPIENYALHKVACEAMVRESGLEWTILRLAASLPIAMRMDPGMFDVPPDNRMEYVHTRDAGLAFARAAGSSEVWGKVLLIGGGPRCQYRYREITSKVLGAMGLGPLPDEAFASVPFATDWLDTEESQRLLGYQRYTLDEYVRDMKARLGARVALVRAFRPVARYFLLQQSPYACAGRSNWVRTTMQGLKLLKGRPARVRAR
jgi:nucleoside-diphosphate-sugar epimerase